MNDDRYEYEPVADAFMEHVAETVARFVGGGRRGDVTVTEAGDDRVCEDMSFRHFHETGWDFYRLFALLSLPRVYVLTLHGELRGAA